MRTGLYDKHRHLGAKIVDFAGWEMPVQYKGIIHEHLTVRQHVGIFDVSHMGRISIYGADAEKFLDHLSVSKIAGKKPGSATYTVWCTEKGGCVDDLIIYKVSDDHFFVVVNASNRQKDLEHLKWYAEGYDVVIKDHYQEGILAIQGPKALSMVEKYFKEAKALKPMHFMSVNDHGETIILSGTGYTGSGGCEIYGSTPAIIRLWDKMLDLGKEENIEPIGLGARDTLRLEMGYALYGHELTEEIAPSETVSSWTICWKKKDFLGKDALVALEDNPKKRNQYGVILQEKGIARENYPVLKNGKKIGHVTSGTMSPSLGRAIAMIIVEGKYREGDNVEIQIRNRTAKATITKLPFKEKT